MMKAILNVAVLFPLIQILLSMMQSWNSPANGLSGSVTGCTYEMSVIGICNDGNNIACIIAHNICEDTIEYTTTNFTPVRE